MSTNHNLFGEKGEPKRYRTEVLLLTSLTPYRLAKPVHKTFLDLNRPNQLKIQILSVWHWTSSDNTPKYQVNEWTISEFEIEGMEYWN